MAIVICTFGALVMRAELAGARQDAQAEAVRRGGLEARAVRADLEKFRILPLVLSEFPTLRDDAARTRLALTEDINPLLSRLAERTGASVIYLLDERGVAIAASNAAGEDSFVGRSFEFRPYFIDAIRTGSSEYFAVGTVTGRPGLFLARRLAMSGRPTGVIVVKMEFEGIEQGWAQARSLSFITDADGLILIAADPAMRFRTTRPLNPSRQVRIGLERQFGSQPLRPSPLELDGEGLAADDQGARYAVSATGLAGLPWRQYHLEPLEDWEAAGVRRALLATLVLTLLLAALSAELLRRRARVRRMDRESRLLEAQVLARTTELSLANDNLQQEALAREAADQRYRDAREELAQANRLGSIGTITTTVAHEMNQPLAAIGAAAQNALKLHARGQDDTVRSNLELIVSLTSRIGSITAALRQYARRGRRADGVVDIGEAIDGAVVLVGHGFRRAGVILDRIEAASRPRIFGEKIRVEQVLVNLLQNALAAVEGIESPRVKLEVCDGKEGWVTITISDNGSGIDPAVASTLFDPFVTGKPEGTGLGLGIARDIVTELGGTLDLLAPTGVGAAFQINLPRMGSEATS